MRTTVVGAGPTGLFTAIALARRGHRVTVLDRDAGPAVDGSWARRGVMQFHHPHGFRPQIVAALQAEMPEVWDRLLAAGVERVVFPAPPGAPEPPAGFRARRPVVERVLRAAALAEPGVTWRGAHVDEVVVERGRAAGVRIGGGRLGADLVVDASGRSGRVTPDDRAAGEGADCGIAYVSRQYRLRPGAERGPMTSPLGSVALHHGYQAIVFLHDHGVFSVLVARSTADRSLVDLRRREGYEAAVAAIPTLAAWTDPQRAEPVTDVLPGGRLHNTYRGQLDVEGRVPLPGLVRVGDTVCTTNPTAGRGITTSLMQARRLLALLDEHGPDHATVTLALDAWCTGAIRPWFLDHVTVDEGIRARWAGADVDLTRPLPSDLVVSAVEADPSLMPQVGPYLAMNAPPASLDAVQPRARELYAGGFRPSVPAGPTREELAAVVAGAVAATEAPSATSRA